MRVGAVVLAGGRSTRMGAHKADLDWHGKPLVQHVAHAAAEATGGRVVVVASLLQRVPPDLDVVRDPIAGRGPLMGLAAGLWALRRDADVAFVCATDQPFAHEVVPALLEQLKEQSAVAYDGQPLGALYRIFLATVAEQRLAEGDASLRGLLAAIKTHTMAGEAPPALRNLNTPEEYAEALRSSGGRAC